MRRPDAWTVGVLIALFERAVGFYGQLVNINAYHQPGVEAGKKAAAAILAIQQKVLAKLPELKGPLTAAQMAEAIGEPRSRGNGLAPGESPGRQSSRRGQGRRSHASDRDLWQRITKRPLATSRTARNR